MDEFPWVAKGGLLDGVLPESVLVQSLPLNNQVQRLGSGVVSGTGLGSGMRVGVGVREWCCPVSVWH